MTVKKPKKQAWQDFVDFCPLRSELQKAIKSHGLSKFEKEIIQLAKPSQRLTLIPNLDKSAISRFGGEPLCPSNFDWPVTRDRRPLSFLCQIDLGEFSFWSEKNHLPPEGSLAFFYNLAETPWGIDSDEDDGWKVFYFDEDEKLTDIPSPLALNEKFICPRSSIRFVEDLTIPDLRDAIVQDNEVFMSDQYKSLYKSLVLEDKKSKHRFLGFPELINYDARLDCHFAFHSIDAEDKDVFDEENAGDLDAGAANWELILQIDSDTKAGVDFENKGRIYLFLEKEEILARRFENCWLTLQSHN